MQSKATTVSAYLAELPPDRRAAINAVRDVILRNLDKDYEEGMGYGMIGYSVPHRVFPPGYHCNPAQPLPFAGIASQKQYMSVYLMSAYGDSSEEKWIREGFARAGKKLDMGKCCIRFKKLEDLPLNVIGEAVRRMPAAKYIEHYVRSIATMSKKGKAAVAEYSPKTKAGGARKTASGRKAPSPKPRAAAPAARKSAARKSAVKRAARRS